MSRRTLVSPGVPSPGSSVIIEHRSRHRDCSWCWIEAVGTNLLAEPGVNAIVYNFQDIARRMQVEEAMVESEERFRVALKTSPVVLFNQDRDERRVIETGIGARDEVERTSGGMRNVYDLNIEPLSDSLGKTPNAVSKEKTAEIAADFMTRFYHVQVGD